MRIKRKFKRLTRRTYPHGQEHLLEGHLPAGHRRDPHGNYYVVVGDPTTMFTCHLDTVGKDSVPVTHVVDGDMVYTDGRSILGADDKAGMVVLLYMIHNRVPGVYYFFLGEESGCIGSSRVALDIEAGKPPFEELNSVNKVVSFDRRGTSSVITEQLFYECCSGEFADELVARLNASGHGLTMRTDDTGVCTDSAQFIEIYPECTNISVGYYNEHTNSECQDLGHLVRICKAAVSIDWDTLPVARDPRREYNRWNRYTGLEDWDSPWDSSDFGTESKGAVVKADTEFTGEYFIHKVDPSDGIYKKALISKTWIFHETLLIKNALEIQGRNIKDIDWDGDTCWILEHGQSYQEFIGRREDLGLYLHLFGEIPPLHIRYEDDHRAFLEGLPL